MVQFVNTNVNTPVSTAKVSKTPTGTKEIEVTVSVYEPGTTTSAEVMQQAEKMRNDAVNEAKTKLKSELDKLKDQVGAQAKVNYGRQFRASKGVNRDPASATLSTTGVQMTALGKTFDISGNITATTVKGTPSQVTYKYAYNTNNIPSVQDFAKYISDNLKSKGVGVE